MKRLEAVITGAGEVMAREAELRELSPGEIKIKVHASLISPGTEVSGIRAKRENPGDSETDVFGYSSAGEIIEVAGEHEEFKVGMRVAAMGGRGAHHANFANIPVNMAVPIPDNVSYAEAAYACLGATALQAVRRTEPQLGEYGLVLGMGIVGNLTAQLCQLSGARMLGWETIPSRIDIARQCGISNIVDFVKEDAVAESRKFAAPYGNDFAVFAFGGNGTKAWESVKECMKLAPDTHKMGRVVLVGGCQFEIRGGASSGNLDIRSSARTGAGYKDVDYENGRDYPNAFVQFTTQRNLREIIALISEKRLLVDPMTTHKFPLTKVGDAVNMLLDHPDQAMGCILEMEH